MFDLAGSERKVKTVKSKASIQKFTGHIIAILKGILFIGISVQIVMGIVWMCRNFSHVPQFEDSLFYMQVSRTLRCDEYTGILYPLFLRLVRRNHYIVYGVQLTVAYIAAGRFLHVFLPGNGRKLIWKSLAFVTIPVVMQCHLAMLPCSLAASLLLLELSLLAEAVRKVEKRTLKKLAWLCLCWLALALLLPEYLYLGAAPVVLFGCCSWRQWGKQRRIKCYSFLLAAAFAGMILSVNSLTRTQGLYGRFQKTPLTTLTQRIAWSSLTKDFERWIDDMEDLISSKIIFDASNSADDMESSFFSVIEQAVADQSITEQQAEEFYGTLIKTAWKWHRSVIVKQVLWDVAGYGASPTVLQLFLEGKGYDTYSNRNYDFFLEAAPRLSKLYMDYGSWWFTAAAALTVVQQILQLSAGGLKGKKAAAETVLCCLITAGAMILWYTIQGAGIQDYKKTAVIDQMWMAWTVLLLAQGTPGQGAEKSPASEGKRERDM